ncbi:MAG: hypothetical protein U0841_29280 [Chloroflexia bacterium]
MAVGGGGGGEERILDQERASAGRPTVGGKETRQLHDHLDGRRDLSTCANWRAPIDRQEDAAA